MRRIAITSLTVLILGTAIVASQLGFGPAEAPTAKTWHAFGAIQPRIAPDGDRIAFSYHGSIWTMPRDGGTMTRLTTGDGFDIEPVWSPDGKQIAYINSPSMAAGQLRMIDSTTGAPVPLPKAIQITGMIAYNKIDFHPDGGRLLSVLRVDGKDHGLAWYDLTTGEVATVVKLPRWSRYALSCDGDSVFYTTTMNVVGQQGGNDGSEADIWQVSASGGEPVKIARFPCRIHDLCCLDQRTLCVVSELGGVHYDLWRLELDNPIRSARKLTFGQADENRPSVTRDGRWLLYTDNREGCTSLVLRDLACGLDRTLAVNRLDFKEPTGTLRLRTFDKKTAKATTARISIEREGGKYHAPVGSLHRVLNSYGHFYCQRESTLTLPAGTYRLRALRGPEYRAFHRSFQVEAGKTLDLDAHIERWISPAEDGWYSGENHIHANYGYGEWYNSPATMLEQRAGEALSVCNFMVANSDTNGVFDREFFRGGLDPLSTDETLLYWNEEFRSTIWGHMTLVNLRQIVEPVFTGFKNTTNPWDVPTNADVADRVHVQNGLVNYTHVAQNPDDPYQNPYTGKGIPVDVALGKIDSLDLNATYRGTVVIWYRLLNCGFHLPASAGTDCFLNRIRSRLPGGDRVYIKVDGAFSYENWIEGLRAGRTFVTNGPILELSVNKLGLGQTLRLGDAGDVSVTATARSQFPMDRVELVYNGQVVESGDLSSDRLSSTMTRRIQVDKSGWLALRALGPGHPDHPMGSQYAHTSPVYVEIDGKPSGSREDAESLLKWIDRLSLALRVRDRIPNKELKDRVRSQLERARAVYSRIAARSQ